MESCEHKTYRVGSRMSELALIQTKHVISELSIAFPHHEFEIVKMNTTGDKILGKALPKIGEKSLFTKELEIALEEKTVDFVVHSLKDLPTSLPENKAIAAVLKREDPSDVVILNERFKGRTLDTLEIGSVIGTSSLRRTAQLSKNFPQLNIINIRGNLNTRLRKLNEGETYAGIVLAQAGVRRLGWSAKIDQVLSPTSMLYAVGQGALAVECRQDDDEVLSLLQLLVDRETTLSVVAERSFLKTLGGGCSAPVGVHAVTNERTITLKGGVFSLDGSEAIINSVESALFDKSLLQTHIEYYTAGMDLKSVPKECPFKIPRLFCGIHPSSLSYMDMEIAEKLGSDLAELMIQHGALNIMEAARREVLSSVNT